MTDRPKLTVVEQAPMFGERVKTTRQRLAELRAEEAAIKAERLRGVYSLAATLGALLTEIAEERPTTGLTDIARRTAEELDARIETMRALGERK